jgi:hypothetical protein
MRKAFFILVSGCFLVTGCGREAPPPKEEPPSEEWLKRQELAARAAAVEAALDQVLVSAGRDDARALELVRGARADLLSAARRTADPEHRRILIEAQSDLEPVETFLEGVNEVNPPPAEIDLEWLRETIAAVRLSLAPVSDGYTDKLYGRYEPARPPERRGEMGPVPAERKRRTAPPPEATPERGAGETPAEPPPESEGLVEPGE